MNCLFEGLFPGFLADKEINYPLFKKSNSVICQVITNKGYLILSFMVQITGFIWSYSVSGIISKGIIIID